MAKFLKSGFLSIKMFEEDDKDWTTAELTRKEYFDLVDKIFSLKEIVKELKTSEKIILNEKNYYQNKYNRINNEYQNKLNQLGVPSGKRGITTLRIFLTIDAPFIFNVFRPFFIQKFSQVI